MGLVGLALLGLVRPAPAVDGDALGMSLSARLFAGEPHDVVLFDPLAYVGLDSGLMVYDVSDPTAWLPLGQLALPSPALDLAFDGGHVYVAAGESGVYVVDVADPSDPIAIARLPTAGTAGIAVGNGIAYLAEADATPGAVYGLRTVDVSDPAVPTAIGFLPLANGATDVAVVGSIAYLTLGSRREIASHGLAVVSVSSPAAPSLFAFVDTGEPVHDVIVADGHAYLAAGLPQSGELIVVDVSFPPMPRTIERVPLADAAQGIDVAGSSVQVAAGVAGLNVFDAADPSALVRRDGLPSGGDSCAVAVRGGVTLLGDRASTRTAALTAMDTSVAPVAPIATAAFAPATDVVAEPGLGYHLRGDGLYVLDTSDPFAPFVIGSFIPGDANLTAAAVEGGLAVVAGGRDVRLVALGDLTAPVEVGRARVSAGLAVRPILSGSRLWIVNGRGIDVFDVSTPASPSELGTYRTGGWSADLAIDGTVGFLVSGTELHVLDLAAPASIAPFAILDLGEGLYAVDVQGDLVTLSGAQSYLITVDVSEPGAPSVLARLSGGPAFDVVLDGVTATIAADQFGVLVADVGDPSFPSFLAFYDTSGSARAVALDGPVVHVAASAAQHWLLSCDACAASCALGVTIQATSTTICAGTPLDLTAVPRVLSGCPSGEVFYRWFEDGWPIVGATEATYSIPASQAPGAPTFMVEVTCADDPSCARRTSIGVTVHADTWPAIAANSLMVVRHPSDRVLSWTITSGSGETNVHRTGDRAALPGLAVDLATVIGAAATATYTDAAEPPVGEVLYYRVFGRSTCTGVSVDP